MKNLQYPFVSLTLFVLMIWINYLSNALPINGYTPAQLSDLYPNLFVPAGFTFSIWGIIYLLLALHVIAHFYHCIKNNKKISAIYQSFSKRFWLSCLLNIGWIFAWHYQFMLLSALIMLGLLFTLLHIYLDSISTKIKLIKWPFSLYAGWISVALIANITTVLVSYGYHHSESFWASFMIFISCMLGVLLLRKYNDLVYASVIFWAFFGIFTKQMSINDGNQTIILSVCLFATILFIFALYINLSPKRQGS